MTGKFNEAHSNSLGVTGTCLKTGERVTYLSLQEAGRNGYLPSKISLCINGERRQHKGMTWEKTAKT